jgi:hypothetical protein
VGPEKVLVWMGLYIPHHLFHLEVHLHYYVNF